MTGGATGASWTVQLLPSQPIASAEVTFCPTATQRAASGHDAASR